MSLKSEGCTVILYAGTKRVGHGHTQDYDPAKAAMLAMEQFTQSEEFAKLSHSLFSETELTMSFIVPTRVPGT